MQFKRNRLKKNHTQLQRPVLTFLQDSTQDFLLSKALGYMRVVLTWLTILFLPRVVTIQASNQHIVTLGSIPIQNPHVTYLNPKPSPRLSNYKKS
jgi:hypothetical protein